MNTQKLAVFCYYFPPLNEVGGRRWAKFSAFLAEKGWQITVFTCQIEMYPEYLKNKGWERELNNVHDVIHVKSDYPLLLHTGPVNFFQKILYRIYKFKMRHKTRGNIYDPSQLWETQITELIEPVLQQRGISKIVVTGAPFAYMFHSIKLKNRNPKIQLYADFRDLWIDSKLGYGQYVKQYQGEKVYYEEMKRQKLVLKHFDQIWTVSSDIASIFREKYLLNEGKIKIIPNGFDPADGLSFSNNFKPFSGKIRFLYFGTINCGRSYYFKFINALKILKVKTPELFRICSFTFIGNTNKSFSNDLNESGMNNIIQLERKSLAEIQELIVNYDFLLYFKLESDLINSFATKFFDYLRMRLPIVVLSPEGDVTNYIRESKIGYILNENNVEESLEELLNAYCNGLFEFDSTQKYDQFNIEMIVTKLIGCLMED